MKKKIYFKGYYGFKNIGDDIFCVSADWICNNIWQDIEAIFIGENLPKLSKHAKSYHFNNNTFKKIFELFTLFKVDKIIYFGGSLLHSRIKGIFDIKYYLNKFKSLYNKLGTIGTSIGPFKEQNDMDSMKNFLNKFKFICVRDYSSLEILRNMGVSQQSSFCFDPAILINDIYPSIKKSSPVKSNRLKLGVSLCHYERYVGGNLDEEEKREIAVEALLDEIIKSNDQIFEIVFFIFHGGKDNGDAEITNDFHRRYKDKIKTSIIEYTNDTEEFCRRLADCDLIFGIRLHSGILAYSLEIPFLLVEYHNKCTEFLNTINYNDRIDINNHENNIRVFNNIITSIANNEKTSSMEKMIKPEHFKKIIKEKLENISI